MSELKVYHCNEWHNECTEFYLKYEVDKIIEELKDEISRKEAVEQRWFERCMEARTENVRLKRALWIARAKHAQEMAWNFHEKNLVEKCAKWDNVHLMCRAKAEKYK